MNKDEKTVRKFLSESKWFDPVWIAKKLTRCGQRGLDEVQLEFHLGGKNLKGFPEKEFGKEIERSIERSFSENHGQKVRVLKVNERSVRVLCILTQPTK